MTAQQNKAHNGCYCWGSLTLITTYLLFLNSVTTGVYSFSINNSNRLVLLPNSQQRYSNAKILMSSTPDDGEAKEGMSFDDATAALRDAEDKAKSASRGAMLEEDDKKFQAKKEQFDEMRARIRSRASDLNVEKSVATVESIKAATKRAAAGEEANTPTVDLSKFGAGIDGSPDPEDELTDEQMAEIDKVGQLNIVEQVKEELKNTRFPTPSATLKQAVLMLVIFFVTAGVILKADEFLRYQYTDWGFIPRAGEVLDYSDLSLPEGFTDQMTDNDLANL
mmetsp:Transcript_22259/g.25314  ORF Transcript_22259/g.25314 Transcript_22259/m.25314 type:complete len:279 (-) Transcript_22259:209-1045(-)